MEGLEKYFEDKTGCKPLNKDGLPTSDTDPLFLYASVLPLAADGESGRVTFNPVKSLEDVDVASLLDPGAADKEVLLNQCIAHN